MIINSTLIENTIRKNYKKFQSSEFYFGEDSRMNSKKDWNSSSFKILMVFLSCGKFRSNSNTFNAIYSIVKKDNINTFIDYCYYPYYEDKEILKQLELPFIFGNVSHKTVNEYDLVFINCSVIKEVFNLPYMLHNSSIPLSNEERMKDNNIPLLVLGGSSASVAHILFGNINYEGDNGYSLIDIAMFGNGERNIPDMINTIKASNTKYKSKYIEMLFKHERLKDYLYYPNAYKYTYKEDKFSIESIQIKENYPKKIKIDVEQGLSNNFSNKILNLDGSFTKHGDLLISSGCTKYGNCVFCLEGSISGAWKEKDINTLEEDIKELRMNVSCEALGIFSFNSNYYSKLPELINIASQYFNRISLLASRADVYADNMEFLELSKKLGTIKVGIAAEGISDKIRNNFLNKNLPKHKFYKAVSNIMKNDFLTIKINYILTGKETIEDFDEWFEDLNNFITLKNTFKYKTRVSITVTNLVIYDQTAIRYEKRGMAIESLNYLESDFIKTYMTYLNKFKEIGVGITIYGTNLINSVEQLILDLGNSATSLLVKASLDSEILYERELTKKMCEEFIKLVNFTYDSNMVFVERPIDYLFYSDLIEFNDERVIEGYKNSFKDGNYRSRICEYSQEEEGMCSNCNKLSCRRGNLRDQDENTIINNNNTIAPNDININNNNINNLNVDDDINDINITTFNNNNYTIDDDKEDIRDTDDKSILNLTSYTKERETILRTVIDRRDKYDYVDIDTQITLIGGKIQKVLYKEFQDDNLLKLIKRTSCNSLSSVTGNHLKPYFSGKYINEWYVNKRIDPNIIKYLNDNISLINKDFISFNIDSLSIDNEYKLTSNDFNLFIGYIDSNYLSDFFERYENNFIINDKPTVITKDIRKSVSLMTRVSKIDKLDIKLYYKKIKGFNLIALITKLPISPYLVIKTLYPKVKLTDIYSISKFKLVNTVKYIKMGLKCSCGNNKLHYNLATMDMDKVCINCQAKMHLNRLEKILYKP